MANRISHERCDYARSEPSGTRSYWSRDKLASEGGVPALTVADFELENTTPRPTTLAAIRAALEAAGVTFTNGEEPG